MRIGIDINPLLRTMTGFGRYLYNILVELLALPESKKDKFYLYSARRRRLLPPENFILREGSGLLSNSGTLWLQTKGLSMMKKDQIDVYWGTQDIIPFGMGKQIKKILTVHDLVWHYYPKTMTYYNLLVNSIYLKRSIQIADCIVTPTNAIKQEIVSVFDIEDEKIKVIPEAVGSEFKPINKLNAKEVIRAKYGIEESFLLSVGTLEPRKNYLTLLEGMNLLKTNLKLVIIGALGWKYRSILKYIESNRLEDKVILPGFVSDKDLILFYNACEIFITASVYEGFGLPVLEAMSCAVPIIASDIPAIREVAQDSAVYFEPDSVEKLVSSINLLIKDANLRNDLSCRGLILSRMYDWRKSARLLYRTIKGLVC